MVVAGGTGQNEPGQGRVIPEVLSLDSNVPLPDCLNQLGNLDYVTSNLGGAPLRRGIAKKHIFIGHPLRYRAEKKSLYVVW